MLFTIYVITILIWFTLLVVLAFSPAGESLSARVFNFIIVLAVIPVLNTICLILELLAFIRKDSWLEEFKESCIQLDKLIDKVLSKFKK